MRLKLKSIQAKSRLSSTQPIEKTGSANLISSSILLEKEANIVYLRIALDTELQFGSHDTKIQTKGRKK